MPTSSRSPTSGPTAARCLFPSPLRYPGGKSWLLDDVRAWLASQPRPPRRLVEPFAGGASVSLASVMENRVGTSVLIEADPDVAAFWQTLIHGDADDLIAQVLDPNLDGAGIHSLLEKTGGTVAQRALRTFLRNRVNHGGVLAAGAGRARRGENGRGMTSRWYPATLAQRMSAIVAHRHRLRFEYADGLKALPRLGDERDVYFIDAPYTASKTSPGKRLYNHWHLDHERLFSLSARLPGDVLMTYDHAPEIVALASRYGFDVFPVSMTDNKNRRRSELLIGRDLDWARNRKGRTTAPRQAQPAKL